MHRKHYLRDSNKNRISLMDSQLVRIGKTVSTKTKVHYHKQPIRKLFRDD